MICPKCKNEIDEGSKFCPYCGSTIERVNKKKAANSTPKMLIIILCVACVISIGVSFFINSSSKKAIQDAYEAGYADGQYKVCEQIEQIYQCKDRLEAILTGIDEHKAFVDEKLFNEENNENDDYAFLNKYVAQGQIKQIYSNAYGLLGQIQTICDNISGVTQNR